MEADSMQQATAIAALARDDAASHGWELLLSNATPIVPDEAFDELTWHGTWGEIEDLLSDLRSSGAAWVNLRFALEAAGSTLIRYEARPTGTPFDNPRAPAVTGGFDCHRLLSHEEFRRHHRP